MIPQKGSEWIELPLTFDASAGISTAKSSKGLWVFLLMFFWLFTSIIALIIGNGGGKWWYILISFIVVIYLVRFLVVRELFYRKKRAELKEKEYMLDHSMIWDIYEISQDYPYLVSFSNGTKGVFITLDKGVIIGKGPDAEYYHHEAVADALQQMAHRGIEAIHIDLMDVVGRDERLIEMFKMTDTIKNSDLQKIILRKYDHIEGEMNTSYAAYDTYCFYSDNKSEYFWTNVQAVVALFKKANYVRARVLSRSKISPLVRAVFNLEEFSAKDACDLTFSKVGGASYLKAIWVEKDGERTILNKTVEEIESLRRVKYAENKVKKKFKLSSIFSIFSRKKKEEEDINLFEE